MGGASEELRHRNSEVSGFLLYEKAEIQARRKIKAGFLGKRKKLERVGGMGQKTIKICVIYEPVPQMNMNVITADTSQ